MVIGILHEGDLDISPIQELVTRISTECSFEEPISFVSYPASGQTLPKFLAAAKQFGQDGVDIFIVHIDTDGDGARKQNFQTLVKQHQAILLGMKVVSLIADPHFEVFYTREENSTKLFFEAKPGESLDVFGDNPKQIIENLIKKRLPDMYEFSKNDVIYTQLMKRLDLSLLARKDTCFNDFRQDIINIFTEQWNNGVSHHLHINTEMP